MTGGLYHAPCASSICYEVNAARCPRGSAARPPGPHGIQRGVKSERLGPVPLLFARLVAYCAYDLAAIVA